MKRNRISGYDNVELRQLIHFNHKKVFFIYILWLFSIFNFMQKWISFLVVLCFKMRSKGRLKLNSRWKVWRCLYWVWSDWLSNDQSILWMNKSLEATLVDFFVIFILKNQTEALEHFYSLWDEGVLKN